MEDRGLVSLIIRVQRSNLLFYQWMTQLGIVSLQNFVDHKWP